MARPETTIVKSYVKVMAAIRKAIDQGRSQHALAAKLLHLAKARDVAMVVAMARASRSTRKRYVRAAIRKDVGRLFRLLPSVPRTSRNRWSQRALRDFVYESFRARALSVTTERHLRGLCARPLPRGEQPYALPRS